MRQIQIGLLLGFRQIQRANKWATTLIITIVLFTFLNLVVLSGILLGIVDGSLYQVRTEALGDITVSPHDGETKISQTEVFLKKLDGFHEIESYSPRYSDLGVIEANYEQRYDFTLDPDVIAVTLTGINPDLESQTTRMAELVAEGEFLSSDESGYILLGKYNVDRYAEEFGNVFDSLKDIYPGDKVMISAGEQTREFTVKGILDSKIDLVSVGVYMSDTDFRRLFNRVDLNANQIVIKTSPGYGEELVRDRLTDTDLNQLAEINSFNEEIPKFVVDVRDTFSLLSVIAGATGVIVASITIFIVIFINALSNRRQIGILKAIGVTQRTIEYAYVTQAFFYTFIGSAIGMAITYFGLIPYFLANPIDFPFADTSLSVGVTDMIIQSTILITTASFSGFIAVWIIARRNILDSILDRK
jgi:putative ABC transport system permease protein